MGWSKDVHVAQCWLCLWLDASMMLLSASIKRGLANAIPKGRCHLSSDQSGVVYG
jgi:hypothetical protein